MNTLKVSATIILLIQLLLAGCASTSYTDAPPALGGLYSKYVSIGYSDELKPISAVGIITTDGMIKIDAINGKGISYYKQYKTKGFYGGGRFQLHLLPDTYTLLLSFHDDRGAGVVTRSVTNVTKIVTITNGQVIHLAASLSGRTWTAVEKNGSGALPTIISDFEELTKAK